MAFIFLIDDNSQFRREICLGLVDAGHHVTEASNGNEGLKSFQNQNPDTIITDVVMDNGEGVETMRKIHTLAPQAPVIAISAHAPYLKTMKKLGAVRTFTKPFRMSVLIEAIGQIVSASHPDSN